MDRTSLAFHFVCENKNSSHCHLDITHGSGANPLRLLVYYDLRSTTLRELWAVMAARTESLDAQLLKDLRGLGKPPSFDGNDAEYQDFRFSFRIHVSLVSSVSDELMDRYVVERNPISLAAVRALGEAHLKCCMKMYYALAFITRGSVRTLIKSVEETNGAEAWRLIHSRYAPDNQNRQYALMQKIMMPANGSWTSESGNVLLELRWQMESSTQ